MAMRLEPELGSVSVVVVGSLNPAIFSPDWMLRWGLVTEAEADSAEVTLVHPEVTQFRIGTSVVNVSSDKFSIETTEAPWVTACDLVMRIFGEVLVHTPLSQLGINRSVHFRVRSAEVRDEIGRMLAPLEPWGAWGEVLSHARGGMARLVVQQKWEEGEHNGKFNVTVEPSIRIGGGGAGIYVQVNDHIEMKQAGKDPSNIINFLGNRFDSSIDNSESIIDQIMSLEERIAVK